MNIRWIRTRTSSSPFSVTT